MFFGVFMNKFLVLITALLGFQVCAADAMAGGEKKEKEREVVLTARFIATADLEDSSPLVDVVKSYVGADDAAKWLAAKATMTGQIAASVVRRVLFFINGELYCSCRAGKMPIAVTPVKRGASGFEFDQGQESIADSYRKLAGSGSAEAYDEGTSTWSLTRGGAPILAVTLIPNGEKDPRIISLMHQAAYGLFVGRPILGFDTLPSLYVSMVNPVDGLTTDDFFGKNLELQVGRLSSGTETIVHNYYPGKGKDGLCLMLAGRINQ